MENKFIVSKSNKLINGRYNLGINEQKILITMTSLINIDDKTFNKVEFTVTNLAEMLNISTENLYRDIRKIINNLRKKDIFIDERDNKGKGRIIETSFVTTAIYDNKLGKITLEFSEVLRPYLLELKGFFTSYGLQNALNLSSKYSIRMYEKLKSNQFKKSFIWSLDEMRAELMLTQKSYEQYSNIKLKIITVALEDINKNTDIYVTYEPIKEGKKVIAINFFISENYNNKKVIYKNYDKLSDDNSSNNDNDNDSDSDNNNDNSENSEYLFKLFENKIDKKNIKKILENANYDINRIEKIYEYSKTQNLKNLTGFMLEMVKDNKFQEPKISKKSIKFNNFTQREYDYDSLEKKLLGWDKDDIKEEIMNNFEENIELDLENNNENNIKKDEKIVSEIDTLKNFLEKQLEGIFGNIKFKTWLKFSIENFTIIDNIVYFYFTNDFSLSMFKKEFKDVVIELLASVDENLQLKELIKE